MIHPAIHPAPSTPRLSTPLTGPGVAVLLVGVTLLVTGVLVGDHPVIAAWGAVPLALLVLDRYRVQAQASLARRPAAGRATRRRGLQLSWSDESHAPPSCTVGSTLALSLRLGLPSGLRLRNLTLRPVAASPLTFLPERAAPDAAGREVAFSLTCARVGVWKTHGVLAHFFSPLGLHAAELYLPAAVEMTAFPRPAPAGMADRFLATRSALREGADRAPPRAQAGLGSELRELRDHVPGDPFKHIAWKATARTGRLIVREFEPELSLSAYVALDLSPTMRLGLPGGSRLDHAVDVAYTLASRLARGRDRVGFLTFDARVLAFRRAARGRRALVAVVDELLGVHQMAHEDLTAITYGELVARVAEYLDRQLGVALPGTLRGGKGRLVVPDPDTVLGYVRDDLRARRLPRRLARGGPDELAADPDAAQLRLFCQLHGIELPFRPTCSPTERAAGFRSAFERVFAAGGGPHVVLVLTDADGVRDDEGLVRTVRRARVHRHRVVFLVTGERGPAVAAPASPPLARALDDLYGEEEALRHDAALAVLRRAGATVLPLHEAARVPRVVRALRPIVG